MQAGSCQVIGKGETEPVASCDNTGGRKALIQCLAPNRRVTVDVAGCTAK